MTNYELDNNRHAKYSLNYHLILVVKYRKKVFTNDEIINRLKEITNKISLNFGCEILNQECDNDHIHILFKSKPQVEMIKFINSLKGVSSRHLRKEFPELKKMLWGDSFWSNSYCLITTGQTTLEILKQYVESQPYK